VYDKTGFENMVNKIVRRYKANVDLVWGTPFEETIYVPGFHLFSDTFGERSFKITKHPVTASFDFDQFKIDGYTYLGCIKDENMMGLVTIHGNEHLEGRDISDFVNSFDNIPCHNCNRRHKRKVGHLFLHNDSNEILVFGSSCAKNFFGINFDRLLGFFDRVSISFGDGWDDDFVRGYRDKTIHWRSAARFAYFLISKDGYLSATKAREWERTSTGTYVRELYNGNRELLTEQARQEMRDMEYPDFDVLFNTEVVDPNKENKNDFEHNLLVLQEKMRQDMVTYHDHGFITFMVYNQFFKTPAPERVEYILPEWAEKGRRVKKNEMDITAEVSHIHSFNGSYGLTHIYSFVSDNVRFKWFTGNDQNVEVGDTVKLDSFSVKDTEDNQYGKSVIITRARLTKNGVATRTPSNSSQTPHISKSDKDYFERLGININSNETWAV
jgi:hypothetical protein